VRSLSQAVIGVEGSDQFACYGDRRPLGVMGVGIADVQVAADRVGGDIEVLALAHVQKLHPVTLDEAVATAFPQLGVEPERGVVRQSPGHVASGQDRNRAPHRVAAPPIGQPPDAALAQPDLVMAAQAHQLTGRTLGPAAPALCQLGGVASWLGHLASPHGQPSGPGTVRT
jgi:hypothetical protein